MPEDESKVSERPNLESPLYELDRFLEKLYERWLTEEAVEDVELRLNDAIVENDEDEVKTIEREYAELLDKKWRREQLLVMSENLARWVYNMRKVSSELGDDYLEAMINGVQAPGFRIHLSEAAEDDVVEPILVELGVLESGRSLKDIESSGLGVPMPTNISGLNLLLERKVGGSSSAQTKGFENSVTLFLAGEKTKDTLMSEMFLCQYRDVDGGWFYQPEYVPEEQGGK